ncbi:beta strand repeat-containing protein [Leifsonia aquatica]|uniref:beta strand repeat-containing protein n=1 Tax=Leifsonia aquatica TaxID=144185 RepID=UPI003822C236
MQKRSALVGALMAVCLSLAAVAVPVAPQPAEAATIANTCSTGGTNLADSYGYCWFDFTGLNPSSSTGTVTQAFTESVGSGFTMNFTVTITQSSTDALPVWGSYPAPTWASALFGNTGKNTQPVAGNPAIQDALASNPVKGFDDGNGTATITVSGIQLLDPAGNTVGAYSLAVADAETTNQGEQWKWTTNGAAWAVQDLVDPDSGYGACRGPADATNFAGLTGAGTQTVTCDGSANSWGALVATTGNAPTQITAVDTQLNTPGKQALAIGINTATIKLTKSIPARVAAGDQFAMNVADGYNTSIGSVTTSGTQKTVTTGTLVVPVSWLQYTLSEAPAGTTTLSNYTQSWSCTSATGGATGLPASGSSGTAQVIWLRAVDQVTCTLTNTARSNPITLTKSWVNALPGSKAKLTISGTGVTGAVSKTSTAGTGPNPDTTNVATATGVVGAVVTLAETSTGTAATYAASFACAQAGTSWTSTGAGFTMPASSGAISCTVTNSTSAQSVQVNKTWIIKDASGSTLGTYNVPAQNSDTAQTVPAGFSAAPTLTGQTRPVFGVTYTGYVAGQAVTVGEGAVTVPSGCTLASQRMTAVNGTALPTAAALPYSGTLAAAPVPTFTITNTVTCTQTLTLVNSVGFGSLRASDWTLTGNGPTGALGGPNGKTGTAAVTSIAVTPAAAYGLGSTSSAAGAQNYAASDWVCTAGGTSVPVTGDSVTVGYGQAVTCTVTQSTAQVVILKHIQGTNGLSAGQFTLTLTPPTAVGSAVSFSGSETATAANSLEVKPGVSYSLAEHALSSTTAYLAIGLQQSTDGGSTWTDVNGNSFTPVAGSTVQYRFVNQAVPALMLPLTGGVGLDVIAYWSIALLTAGAIALVGLIRHRRRRAHDQA